MLNKKGQTSWTIFIIILALTTFFIIRQYANGDGLSTNGIFLIAIFIAGLATLVWFINRKASKQFKASSPGMYAAIILIIILATIFLLSWYYGHRMPPSDNTVGLISGTLKEFGKVGDNAFNWLFGSYVGPALKKIGGIRSGVDFWANLLLYFYYGLVAAILMYIGSLAPALADARVSKWMKMKPNAAPSKPSWLASIAGNKFRIIIFALVFTTLMQIGIINRIIQIITFYWAVNWFIYPFVLAIIIGYLPELLVNLTMYYRFLRYQRVVMQTKAGNKIVRMFGGG